MVTLFVEGGGKPGSKGSKARKIGCGEGFHEFIKKLGLKNQPKISACGPRQQAYKKFCLAISSGKGAVLLVDSEEAVDAQHQQGEPHTWKPWAHLKTRQGDGWAKPPGSADTDCHLMVQVMESWFLADRDTLKKFFGQAFRENALPAPSKAIEGISKQDVYDALERATKDSKKGAYGKGAHSFELLAEIDPAKVTQASSWAKRFVDELRKRMSA